METVIDDYSMDFPELAEAPDESYAQTLIRRGVPEAEAGIHVLLMDIQVMHIVDLMQDVSHLAFAAPETIDENRVLKDLDWNHLLEAETDHAKELLACVSKAVRVLRCEMEPNAIWPTIDDEALE